MGEDTDGMVESTAKLREEILALSGVDIMKDKNTFKSTYQILDELAAKWKDLTDIQQASITELIAGKRQGNIISSLMNNFDIARNALETSANSEGSAMNELSKWQQSLEARTLKLKAAWQGLSQSFLSSDFLKTALDGVIALVKGLDSLIKTVGTIPTLAGAFSIFQSLNGKGIIKTEDVKNLFGDPLNALKSLTSSIKPVEFGIKVDSSFKDSLKTDVQALFNYRDAIKNGTDQTQAFETLQKNASSAAVEYANNNKTLSNGIMDFAKQQKSANVAIIAQNKSLSSVKGILDEYNSGCKNTVMSQEDFTTAVKQGNSVLGNYLSGVSTGEATMGGYIVSLIGAKVSTLALQVATMALNAAITMGISFLISKWINAESELADKVDEVTSKYKEQHDELVKGKSDFDTSNEDSLASRYDKLSKGVDTFGKNVSLTADEYSEYQSVVNSIAEQIPSLVAGYDSQGNAILSCAGNVNELTAAYEKLIKTQNDEVLGNYKDVSKDFKNVLDDARTGNLEGSKLSNRSSTLLEGFLNKQNPIETITKVLDQNTQARSEIIKALQEQGLAENVHWYSFKDTYDKAIEEAIKENPEAVRSIIDNFNETLDSEAEGMKTVASAVLSNAFDISGSDYATMSEGMKNLATQIVNSFDATKFESIVDSGQTVEEYINGMLDDFKKLGENGTDKKIEAALNLETQFNGGEVSYGEYVKGIKEAGKLIDSLDLDQDVKDSIKLSLNTKEVTDNYKALRKRLTKDWDMSVAGAEKFLYGLSSSEYQVAIDLLVNGDVDLSGLNLNKLRERIEKEAKLQDALNFTIDIDAETSGLDAFNTAMQESVSSSGLSSDSIAALKSRYSELESEGYDLSKMFEETSNGIHINQKAVNELEQAYANKKLTEAGDNLNTLKDRYDELTEEIQNCTDAEKISSLYAEQQSITEKINDLATLTSQYEGLASAYTAWQNAESAGQERDMYEGIIEGFENVGDEISRGWFDDGTIKFLELLTGRTDLATKSGEELNEVYKSLDDTINSAGYSISDFFTVDDNGKSTNAGVYNFLETVEAQFQDVEDVIQKNENGDIIGFNFDVVGGDEAVAKALGISKELVQIMTRAADDAGFVVNIDGNWTQLADLKTYAEEANQTLKDLGKTDVDFNFDASSFEDLNAELEKSMNVLDQFRNEDGSINLDMDGAKEALNIASYFTAMVDSLSEPIYMKLETNQVEEDLQEPLKEMQEFEDLSKKKHQLQLTGTDGESLQKTEERMSEIADDLKNLDKDTKIKLGIDGLSTDEIKDKLEKGEIEIPATVDIQLDMSDDLKDMRLMMMKQLGLVSDEEVKLKIGYDLDDSLVDLLDEDEKKIVVDFVSDHEDWFNELSEDQKKIVVDIVANSDNPEWFDTLDEDEKKIVVDFVSKNQDEFDDLTDEEKEVIVNLVTDDKELEKLKQYENNEVTIKAFMKVFGVDKVEDLKSKLDGLTDEQIQVVAQVAGQVDVDKLKNAISNLDDKTVQAIAEALGKGDVEGLKSTINSLDPKTVQAIAEAFGYSDVNELNKAIDNLDPKTVQAIAQALGIKDVNTLKEAINRLSPKTVQAVATVSGKDAVDNLKNSINGLKDKTVTVWASIQKKASDLWSKVTGGSDVNGTANVNGTAYANGTAGRAFKQGDWGTKDSGTALVGELGEEVLVRDGKFYTIGTDGAEFIKYKKNDIIFNHKIEFCGLT